MIRRKVKCSKIVKIIFQFRAVGDIKPEPQKNLFDFIQCLCERVKGAGVRWFYGQGISSSAPNSFLAEVVSSAFASSKTD
jgi:hypothetical protein